MATTPDNDHEKKAAKARVLLTLAATGEKVHGPCLSDGEMAALVDGRSAGQGRELPELRAHLADCRKCYAEWLFLKGAHKQAVPRGRLYHLSRFRKLSYIGTALAAAASIAIYLNVVDMEMAVVEKVPMPPVILHDKNIAPVPSIPAPPLAPAAKEERAEPKKVAEQVQPQRLPSPVPPAASVAEGGDAVKGRTVNQAPPPQRAAGSLPEERQKEKAAAPVKMAREAAPLVEQDAAVFSGEAKVARAPAFPAAAVPAASDAGAWFNELRLACQAGRSESDFWSEMVARGVKLQSSQTDQGFEKAKIAALLPLVQGINGPDTLHQQCRLILAELAKEGESR
ncbi:MAG: hypothetical protein OEL83_13405 [Desulforhopalus sp.]|nr:hypothetical protein [Desulforhopalus sp.]